MLRAEGPQWEESTTILGPCTGVEQAVLRRGMRGWLKQGPGRKAPGFWSWLCCHLCHPGHVTHAEVFFRAWDKMTASPGAICFANLAQSVPSWTPHDEAAKISICFTDTDTEAWALTSVWL